jgi:dipeptidyl aminopeptidase/acylaminoacyl peptidase
MAPDGGQVALITTRHFNYGDMTHRLSIVSVRDGTSRPIAIAGEKNPAQPMWSADGARLAYVAQRDTRSRLSVIDAASARSIDVPDLCPGGEVQTASWAPSGARIAVMCRGQAPKPPEEGDIVIASTSTLFNPRASIAPQSIAVFDLAANAGWQTIPLANLLPVSDSHGRPRIVWSSSGQSIWFVATSTDDRYTTFSRNGFVYTVDLSTQTVRQVTREAMDIASFDLSPDGRTLLAARTASVSDAKTFWRYSPYTLWRGALTIASNTTSATSATTSALDSSARPVETTFADVYPASALTPRWVKAADGNPAGVVYFGLFERAAWRLFAFDPKTGTRTAITPRDWHVESFSASADGRTIAVVMSDPNTPAEVFLLHPSQPTTPPQPITRFGHDVRARHRVSDISRRSWKSKDGRFDVDGWLLKPAGCTPNVRCPLIVNVHGGPGVAWTNSFERLHYDDGGNQVAPELYAAHGYMVLMVNPRGDMSYGPEYMAALVKNWESATRNDILAGVDDAIARGEADPDRLGIAGASYGGFVTTYAVSQTDRFKAGSANDPVVNLDFHAAVAYRGKDQPSNYYLMTNFFGGPMGDVPFLNVDPHTVKTPLLLRFGLNSGDARLPSAFFMSGLPFYVYLHTHGVPVEMIMHPKDYHGIIATDRIRDYNQRNLAWFDYWIQGKPYPDAARQKEWDAWRAGAGRGTTQTGGAGGGAAVR